MDLDISINTFAFFKEESIGTFQFMERSLT